MATDEDIERMHAHILMAGLWHSGAECIKNEVTGLWHNGGYDAAMFAWGDPLPIGAYNRQTLRDMINIVWMACVRRGPSNWIPYRVVVAELLKLMGQGGRVSEERETENEWAWGGLGNSGLENWRRGVILPAGRWLEKKRTKAATAIQKRWRGRLGRLERVRRKAAVRRIQRGCHAWILKPVTADGKEGINVRILKSMGV